MKKSLFDKIIYASTVFIIITNSCLVCGAALGKSIGYYTIPIHKQLKNIEQYYNINKKPISVFLTHELCFLEKLKEYKIEYKLINKEPNISEFNEIRPSAGVKRGVGVYWK